MLFLSVHAFVYLKTAEALNVFSCNLVFGDYTTNLWAHSGFG